MSDVTSLPKSVGHLLRFQNYFVLLPTENKSMMMKQLLTIAFALLALATHAQQRYVGGDISLLPDYETKGARYYDADYHQITDMLEYFKQQGLNSMRVRLFVDPSKAPQDERNQGARQDLEYVKALGKRIKDAGLSLMLDFHYSDTWADPSQQWTPTAWQSLNDAELQTKIYEYTRDCLQQMVDAGATPDFIQTGNEISYGMMWGPKGTTQNRCYINGSATEWNRFIALLKKAGDACREVCPQAKIILHSERVPTVPVLKDFFDRMRQASVDYDIIGLSYYPYYHGSLSQLEMALDEVEQYEKNIMIVETGYYYAWQPNGVEYNLSSTWPITPAGQQAFARDLVAKLREHPKVIGLYWWFMEACENGINWQNAVTPSGWYNCSLFNDTDESVWGAGKVMPAMQELKSFLPSPAGIDATVIRIDRDQHWYNLQGMRLDSRPQRTGLYITQGDKVIIH